MSSIEIVNVSDKTHFNIGRYFHQEMRCGKHHATIAVNQGKGIYPAGVGVHVHNAANQCWRGPGKRFATAQAAIDNYRTPELKAMIRAAVEAAQCPAVAA